MTIIRIDISVTKIPNELYFPIEEWVEENVGKTVHVTNVEFLANALLYDLNFDDEEDALAFKLRFGYAVCSYS